MSFLTATIRRASLQSLRLPVTGVRHLDVRLREHALTFTAIHFTRNAYPINSYVYVCPAGKIIVRKY